MKIAQNKIRVILVDDQNAIRQDLGGLLSTLDDIELVAQGRNGQEAVALCDQYQPDMVLMDIAMPLMDGITATKMIISRHAAIKIIALTGNSDMNTVQEMIAAGAVGYVLKDAHPEELISIIRAVHNGNSVFSTGLIKPLFELAMSASSAQQDYGLTRRELEILHYMVDGKTNPQIAERLMISLATAKFHISNILRKLGVNTRSAAIGMAVKEHLV